MTHTLTAAPGTLDTALAAVMAAHAEHAYQVIAWAEWGDDATDSREIATRHAVAVDALAAAAKTLGAVDDDLPIGEMLDHNLRNAIRRVHGD